MIDVNEQYSFTVSGNPMYPNMKDIDVYVNPTIDELKEIGGPNHDHRMRFIIDINTMDCYVFSAYNAFHSYVMDSAEFKEVCRDGYVYRRFDCKYPFITGGPLS